MPETEHLLHMKQNVFAGEHFYGEKNRHDPTEYTCVGECREVGVIQAMFQHNALPSFRFALVQRLNETRREAGNEKVTNEYGNRRYNYSSKSSGDCIIDIAIARYFRRIVILVPDMYGWHNGMATGRE